MIIVCYNPGEKLQHTVNSVLKQTYHNFEIVVKDGLSTDHAIYELPENEKLQIHSFRDAGIYDAMNQAIAIANGDYYIFLNCGDSFYDEFVLEHVVEVMQQEKKSEKHLLYYGDTFDELGKTIVTMNKNITPFTCYRHIPCHQACFYSKELFSKRKYDLHFKIRADYEHFLYSYFVEHANPKHLFIVVANYEGGGYSESRENQSRDQMEHRQITRKYIPAGKLLIYRAFMIATLMPVRKFLSRNRYFSRIYDKVKKIFY